MQNEHHKREQRDLGVMWETRLGNQRMELGVESENGIIG
jgi:hypothetical protein